MERAVPDVSYVSLENLSPVPVRDAAGTTGRKVPVREFLLFPWGQVKTSKGVLQFDPECAAQLMDQYRAYTASRDGWLDIDIAHLSQTNDDAPMAHVSAGKFRTETRGDGQWVKDLTYTPEVFELIATERLKFYSPVVSFDDKSRITELQQLALTNIPAMYGAQPLALSTSTKAKKESIMKFNALALTALLFASRSKEMEEETEGDPEAMEAKPHMAEMLGKLGSALKAAHGDGCKLEEAHEGHVVARMPGEGEKTYAKIPYTYEGGKVKLGEPTPVKRGFLPGAHAEPDGDEGVKEEMKKLSARLSTTEKMLFEATGMRTVSAAIGEIERLKTSGGKDLAEKVARLEARSFEAEKEVLLSSAKKSGKWTAGLEKLALSNADRARKLNEDPISAMREVFDSAPVSIAPGREVPPEHEVDETGMQLSAQEKEQLLLDAKRYGVDPKLYTQRFLENRGQIRIR